LISSNSSLTTFSSRAIKVFAILKVDAGVNCSLALLSLEINTVLLSNELITIVPVRVLLSNNFFSSKSSANKKLAKRKNIKEYLLIIFTFYL